MSKQNPVIKNSVDLLKNIIWQYDGNNVLTSLIAQKEAWYHQCHAEFWQNWFHDVFDLRTANDFGLSIWAKILGISFYIPDCSIQLTTEQKRFVCRLRYYQLITRCTIPEVNGILKDMFTAEEGKAYALDPNDMSNITYVFTYQPDSAIATILLKYDLLPRPAAVGINYRVLTYKPFGFGRHYENFGHSSFWHGGRLDNFAIRLNLLFDDATRMITGTLIANHLDILISDVEIALVMTKNNNSTETFYIITEADGSFNYKLSDENTVSVYAKTQLTTPLCTIINAKSNTLFINSLSYYLSISASNNLYDVTITGQLYSSLSEFDLSGFNIVIIARLKDITVELNTVTRADGTYAVNTSLTTGRWSISAMAKSNNVEIANAQTVITIDEYEPKYYLSIFNINNLLATTIYGQLTATNGGEIGFKTINITASMNGNIVTGSTITDVNGNYICDLTLEYGVWLILAIAEDNDNELARTTEEIEITNPEPKQWHLSCKLLVGYKNNSNQHDYGYYVRWGIGEIWNVETDLFDENSNVITLSGYAHKSGGEKGILFAIKDATTNNFVYFLSQNKDAKLTMWINGIEYYLGEYSSISSAKNYVFNKYQSAQLQQDFFNTRSIGQTLNILMQFNL